MARKNVFALDPVEYELERQKAERQGRGIFDQAERPSQKPSPALKPDGLPDYGKIAVETQVPRNLIIALTDAAGLKDGAQKGAFATEAASRVGREMAAGKDARAALQSILGEDAPVDDLIEAAKAVPEYDRIGAKEDGGEAAKGRPERAEGDTTWSEREGNFFTDLYGGGAASLSAAAQAFGSDEWADYFGKIAEENSPAVPSFKDVDNFGEAVRYVSGGIAQSLPEMAAVAGVTAATVLTGGGALLAGGAALSSSALFNAGRAAQRQEEETGEIDYGRAWGAGVAMGALDALVPGKVGGSVSNAFSRRVGGAVADRMAKKGLGREFLKGAGTEAVTEVMQTMIEVGQADPELLRVMVNPKDDEIEKSDQLVTEMIDAALLGGAAGGAFGAGGEAARRLAGRNPDEGPDEGTPLQTTDPGEGEEPATGPEGGTGPISDSKQPSPAPTGPIGRAAQRAPGMLTEDFEEGTRVTVRGQGANPFEAEFVEETPNGVRLRDETGPILIPRGDIENGAVEIGAAPRGAPTGMFPDMKPGGEVALRDADGRDYTGVLLREDESGVTVRIEGREVTLPPREFDQARAAALDNEIEAPDETQEAEEPDVERGQGEITAAGTTLPTDIDRNDFERRAETLEQGAGMDRAQAETRALEMIQQRMAERRAAEEQAAIPDAQDMAEQGEVTPPDEGQEQNEVAPVAPQPPASVEGVEPDRDTPQAAELQSEWWKSLPRLRKAVKDLGMTKEALADQWGDKDALTAAVDAELGRLGDTAQQSSLSPNLAENDSFEIMDEVETVNGETRPTGRRVRVNLETGDVSPMNAEDAALAADESATSGLVDQEQGENDPQTGAIDPVADIERAAQETEENPTPAQAEAENYRTGKAEWQGRTLSIENRKGSTRRKVGPDGKTAWEVEMPAHYGRILKTEGADGDHVDFYMGDNPASESVWVVDQMDAGTGRFDEHKVMLGFDNADAAAETYVDGFSDGKGPDRLGGMRKMSVTEFNKWLEGDTTKPVTPMAKWQDREAATREQEVAQREEAPADDGATDAENDGQASIESEKNDQDNLNEAASSEDRNRASSRRALPKRTVPRRRPLTDEIKNAGAVVDPDGPAGRELRASGITPQNTPGLFRRGGLTDLDNVVVGENPYLAEVLEGDGSGNYFDRNSIIDGLVSEFNGRPVQDAAEMALDMDAQAREQQRRQDQGDIEPAEAFDDVGRAPHTIHSPGKDISTPEERMEGIRVAVRSAEQESQTFLTDGERRNVYDRLDREGGDVEDVIIDEQVRSYLNAAERETEREDTPSPQDAARGAEQPGDRPGGEAQGGARPQDDQQRGGTPERGSRENQRREVAPGNAREGWVIREKNTGEVVMETRDPTKVDALNTERYEAVPVQQHLADLNRDTPAARAAGQEATTERTEAGEQSVIPGAEQDATRSDRARQADQRREIEVRQQQSRMGTTEPQDGPGGIFDTQGDMLDQAAVREGEAEPSTRVNDDGETIDTVRMYQRNADTFAAQVMADLAAYDELFAYPKARSVTLEEVFEEVFPAAKYEGKMSPDDITADAPNIEKHIFRTPSGEPFFVYRTDDEVWFDVSRLSEGEAGSALYAAMGDYAYNSDRTFIGDPEGLSEVALRRRTDAMLSSALKHGTTEHLAPHEYQLRGDENLGAPPLRWREGDHLGNMQALIEVSVESLAHHVPEFRRARYDFSTRTFRNSEGAPLSDEVLRTWAKHPRVRKGSAGRRTLKRGIILNTILRTESGQRPGLLEQIGRRNAEPVGDDLSGTFYHRQIDALRSPLLRYVEGVRQQRATARRWKEILAKAPGVTKAELDWIGFDQWLGSQKGRITRQALSDFLRDGYLEMEDARRRGEDAPDAAQGTHRIMPGANAITPQAAKAMMPKLRAELDRLNLRRVRLRLDHGGNWQGAFVSSPYGPMDILIGQSADPAKTLYHESIHAMRALDLFTEAEWDALRRKAGSDWIERHKVAERYPDLTREERLEEAIAEAFAEHAADKGPPRGSALGRAFKKVARIMRAIRGAMKSAGHPTAEDVFGAAMAGDIGARSAGTTGFIWNVMRSRDQRPGNPAENTGETSGQEPPSSEAVGEVKGTRGRRAGAGGTTFTEEGARQLRHDLEAELSRFIKSGRVELHLAGGFTYGGQTLDGYFYDNVIGVGAKAPEGPKGILRHEIIHALRSKELWGRDYGLFSQDEWRTLAKAARRNPEIRARIEREYPDLNTAGQTEEMIAEMFREWMETRDTATDTGKVLDKLRRIIEAIVNALRRNGANEAAQVMERIRSGEVGARGPDGSGGSGAGARFAKKSTAGRGDTLPDPELDVSPSKLEISDRPEQLNSDEGMGTEGRDVARSPTSGLRGKRRTAPRGPGPLLGGPTHVPDRGVWDELTAAGTPVWQRLKSGASAAHDALDRARFRLQDRFLPVLRAQQALEAATGQPLPDHLNAYLVEETFYGKAGMRLDDIDDNYTRPIIELIARTDGLTTEMVGDWLTARHAEERNKRIAQINKEMPDAGSGMETAEARRILREMEDGPHREALEEISRLLSRLRDESLALRVDAGLLTQQEADALRAMYENYVPLKGFAETENADAALDRHGVGARYNIGGAETQRALGRRSRSFNPLMAAITQAQEVAIRAEKNRVGQAVYNLANEYPSEKMWTVKNVEMKRFFNRTTGMVETRATNPTEGRPGPDEMAVKVDGVEKRVQFHDSRLAEALGNVGADQVHGALAWAGAFNRYLSSMITMLDPEFMVRNAFRDMTAAQINVGGLTDAKDDGRAIKKSMLRNWPKAWAAISGGMKGKVDTEWQKHYREFVEAGAKVHFFQLENPESGLRDLEHRVNIKTGPAWAQAIKTATSPRALFSTRDNPVLGFVERMNLATENAVRLTAFVEARKRGWSQRRAASLAKNLTVNFNRRGTETTALNSLFIFFNAATQGLQVTARVMTTKRGLKVIGTLAAYGMLKEFLNAALSEEDEDGVLAYDKIPAYKRRMNDIWMTDGENAVTIPLPYIYAVFPYMGQQAARVMRGVSTPQDAMGEVFTAALQQTMPLAVTEGFGGFIPTAATLPFEMATNEDWLGRPIRPPMNYNDYGPDAYKFYPSVSEAAKDTADLLNRATGGSASESGLIDISPEYIDHTLGFLTGGAGKFVGRTTDLLAKVANGEDVEQRDIPIARQVSFKTELWLDRSRFYENTEAIKDANARVKSALEMGEEPAPRYRELGRLYTGANKARSQLRKLNRRAARLRDAKGELSRDEFQRRMEAIERAQQGVYDRINGATHLINKELQARGL